MFHFFEKIAREFRLLPWREGVADRNQLIRATALHMIDNRVTDLPRVKDVLRRRLRYHEMRKEDKVLFRQHTAYLKKIVTGWHLVSETDQAAFRAGAIPPSSLAVSIRDTRKPVRA